MLYPLYEIAITRKNFMNKKDYDMEIKRDIYLNKLISKKHNGLIKVVTGIRRCGKSYLLFNLFKDYLLAEGTDEQHIIEIAFDSFENKRFRDLDVLYPYLKGQIADDGMYYVLLDEVQLLGEFESVLNGLIRMKNVDVYVTGSNTRFLSKDVITEFRGRRDEVHSILSALLNLCLSIRGQNRTVGMNICFTADCRLS